MDFETARNIVIAAERRETPEEHRGRTENEIIAYVRDTLTLDEVVDFVEDDEAERRECEAYRVILSSK
jgi:hypothetical protein